MAAPTRPGNRVDLYSSMAPVPDRSGALAVFREGIRTTRGARKTWRYFWLRVSAISLAVPGVVGPLFARRLGLADLGHYLALPILVYSGFALALGAALELIRRPPEREGRSWFRFVFLLVVLSTVAGALAPMIAKHVPPGMRDLVPLILILLGMPLLTHATRGKKVTSPPVEKKSSSSPWSSEILIPRVTGIAWAVFLLTLVGALPGFVFAALGDSTFSPSPGGLPALGHVVLFILVLSLVLGAHAAVAERLWPRFPRLTLLLLLGVPWALTLVIPGFPNCFSLFVSYIGWLEGQFAPPWGLV